MNALKCVPHIEILIKFRFLTVGVKIPRLSIFRNLWKRRQLAAGCFPAAGRSPIGRPDAMHYIGNGSPIGHRSAAGLPNGMRPWTMEKQPGCQPVTNQWPVANDGSAAGKRQAARCQRFRGFLKIDGRFDTIRHCRKNYLIINVFFYLHSLQLLSVCLTKMSIKWRLSAVIMQWRPIYGQSPRWWP